MAGLGMDVNGAIVVANDALYNIETQPRTLANFFGREERIKDIPFYGIRNTRPVVDNVGQHEVEAVGLMVYSAPDGDGTPVGYGIDSVVDQVRPELVQLARPAANRRQQLPRRAGWRGGLPGGAGAAAGAGGANPPPSAVAVVSPISAANTMQPLRPPPFEPSSSDRHLLEEVADPVLFLPSLPPLPPPPP